MVSSKLATKCYAKKKTMDKIGVDPIIKWALIFSTLLALASLWTIYSSFSNGENMLILYISHAMITTSLLTVFVSLVYNWKKKVIPPITFN